jgi:hypothetical protein
VTGEEAREAGAERTGAFNRERPSSRRVQLGELQRTRVATAACGDARFSDDGAGTDVDDRERVRVAVRVDADHVVQPICSIQHTSSPGWGTHSGAGLGVKTASGRTVMGHAHKGRTGF